MNPPIPPQSAFDTIEYLVKKYKDLPPRTRQQYNEDNTRKDFVLPFFRALEWNIDDMREVAAEEKISRGFVDFSFRINGIRRFVLETKRIGEDLNKPEWAQQAIDYAYHKGVTWAVLSDFEGLKIFNAEAREVNPFQAQFKEFAVDDYLPRLSEVWWLSRPAMIESVLDREAEKVFKKVPKTPITQSLFDNLRDWRGRLYKLLREYNRGKLYDAKQIDDAVQHILDRLIFIRTAEDREVEGEKLLALVRELKDRNRLNDLIPELNRRFRELDRVYNSQLFSPHYSEDLELGEASTLADIINGLYGSPANFTNYNFALIDADVLGRVYEQYLGYVLSEREEIEAKKTKRKSQGIYYTPTFVVKYIVQQTLGRYLEERGYNPAHPVRVLDPACGSGSFLIESFDVLDQYLARERSQERGEYGIQDHARQMQILTENIYGVDKDEQAVEVAQLNLLLKALHLRDRLPKLENIRAGDSLISGVPQELEKFFGAKWKDKKPFNWAHEFAKVVADGGFDVIVGNPPYVRIQTLPKDEVAFFNDRYAAATGNYDIYVLFVERALQLLKSGGVFGMILPNKFMQVDYGAGLRKLLSENKFVDRIVSFKEFQVFEAATTYTCLLFLKKQANAKVTIVPIQRKEDNDVGQIFNVPTQEITSETLTEKSWSLSSGVSTAILEKLERVPSTPLLDLPSEISRGSSSGADDVFILEVAGTGYKTREGQIVQIESEILRVPIYATDFGRYQFSPKGDERIIFPYDVSKNGYALKKDRELKKEFPKAYKYLASQRKKLEARKDFQQWYGFSAARNLHAHDAANLVVPLLADRGLYAELPKNRSKYCLMASGGFSISIGETDLSPKYILSLLNSVLLFWNLKQISNVFRGGWITCTKQYVGQLPIRRINFDDATEKKQHDRIVALADEMLELQKEYASATREKLPRADALKRRIDEVDAEIDGIVYRLYGLTEDEIKIIEAG